MTAPSKPPVVKTASACVHTGMCVFRGFLIGTDGANDPTVCVYDGTTAAGEKVVPTSSYDASVLGLNGVSGMQQYCYNGLYIDITCVGVVEVVVQYTPL